MLRFHLTLCFVSVLIFLAVFAEASPTAPSPSALGYGLSSRRRCKIFRNPNYFSEFRKGFSNNGNQPKDSTSAYRDGQKYKSILKGMSTKDKQEFLSAFKSKSDSLRDVQQKFEEARRDFSAKYKAGLDTTKESNNFLEKFMALSNEWEFQGNNHIPRDFKYHLTGKPVPLKKSVKAALAGLAVGSAAIAGAVAMND